MKTQLFFTAILLTLAVGAFSQKQQDRFKEVFDEEMDDGAFLKRENHSVKYRFTAPQQVPDWFTNPPVSEGDEVYAIGISDPGLDSADAITMAVYRARIMAHILRYSMTQLLCDFFVNEADHSNSVVYEHFSRINSIIPVADESVEIIDRFTNRFDETMVLVKCKPDLNLKKEETYAVQLELFKNETESSIYGNYESVYDMMVKSNNINYPDPVFYQLTEYGTRFDVISTMDNQNQTVPIYSLSYEGLNGTDSVRYQYFSHGLWKEYLKAVMTFIMNAAREKPENVQVLTDKYQAESFEKLTRGISVNKMRFVLMAIKAEQNQLKVELKELPL